MTSVLFYDDRGGFGREFNRTHAVGGAEMHLVQLAEFLASHRGVLVDAYVHAEPADGPTEGGVYYRDSRTTMPRGFWDVLIVVGCASLPEFVAAGQTFAFQVVDPRPHPQLFAHLKGRATMVCVSEWQAERFRKLGHRTVVIPVPIPDEWYGTALTGPFSRSGPSFGCFSSWNKGARDTVEAWDSTWGHLLVGSPYSHPDDVARICNRDGVTWLGELRPRETWIRAMQSVRAIARVCTIAETFGVVDVAARAMGIPCYTLCTGEVGSLEEVGAAPFTSREAWAEAIRTKAQHPGGDAERFRSSRVMLQWLALIGG